MVEETVRIQKYLSSKGIASRRKIESMILDGKIKVNGEIAKIGSKVDPNVDIIEINNNKLKEHIRKKVYMAIYKPKGYVTTMEDNFGRKCIKDLIKNIRARVYPIGRLDKDSEGLLLLTNDGDFANFVMHPRNNIEKKYLVTVKPAITECILNKLRFGVKLGEEYLTAKKINILKSGKRKTSVLEITLTEGKNRHIRKMCEGVSLCVIRLKRIAVGNVDIGALKPGEYRGLTKKEVNSVNC